ncbi:MAG: DUF1554 domain-containing protein [Deltaproteobacteria bacterium]|nr:DUF1554 domain-containing protein [Kofleriaceae bacterium]
MARLAVVLAVVAASSAGGCNSIFGFELEGGGDAPGPPKTVVVTLTGDGRGAVTSMPSGINCVTGGVMNCSEDYARGTMVTLTTSPSAGSRFGSWSGGGCSGNGTCTVTLDIDTAVEARFDDLSGGANFVFVTTDSLGPTTFSPLANADAACMAEAAAAGLPGTYRAWLSSSTVDAKDRLGTARGWVRVDGQPVADRVEDIVAGNLIAPIRLLATGEPATLNGAGHTVVLTGTQADGTHAPTTCSDWTSGGGMVRVGNANNTARTWTDWFDGDAFDCGSNSAAIYCFGVDRAAAVTITPTPGRLAFISQGLWTSGGGIASADALCQADAASAGRTGTFKALVALTTASAASRFDAGGAPWVRADGIPLAAPGTSPFGQLAVPLNVRADGTYSPYNWTMTGADSPTQAATNLNCNDWTDGTAGRAYSFGIGESVLEWFDHTGGGQTLPCDSAQRLYCFEQ